MKKEILDQFEKHIEDIKNEADEQDYTDEILALAQFLEVDSSIIRKTDWGNGYEYEVGKEQYPDSYLVFSNYDDAIAEAKEGIRNLFDDIGVTGINWGYLGGIERFLDEDWFKEAHLESNRYYAEDIAKDDPERFVEEAEEFGLDLSQYDYDRETGDYEDSYLIDDFAEAMREAEGYNNDIQWYIDSFGEDDFNHLLKRNPNILDEDALIEEIINVDGVANELARYDGKEHEQDYDGVTYYIYRTN